MQHCITYEYEGQHVKIECDSRSIDTVLDSLNQLKIKFIHNSLFNQKFVENTIYPRLGVKVQTYHTKDCTVY